VTSRQWANAEIYPAASNPLLSITSDQAALLALFHH